MLLCDKMCYHYIHAFQMVSILVLVDVALRLSARITRIWVCNGVSILVLVDVALRPYYRRSRFGLPRSFNPCFSGCCSATQRHRGYLSRLGIVSILVLVDVALRQRNISNPILQRFCFNPCFSGCCSATMGGYAGAYSAVTFQSLF